MGGQLATTTATMSVAALGLVGDAFLATTAFGLAMAAPEVIVLGSGIAVTGLETATLLTGATLASTGGCVTSAMLAVETVSLAAGAAGMACWFLP